MNHFPLFADLTDQPCLVVGGGAVAARKVDRLLIAGARVTVNAPVLGAALAAQLETGAIHFHPGRFDPELIPAQMLIIAATSEPDTNQQVAAAAAAQQRFCNVVDDASLSSAIMPAVVDRSPVLVAISSNGESPVLARLLRQRIETWLPSRIGDLASWAGTWRDRVRAKVQTHAERIHFWQDALDGAPAEQFLAGNPAAADAAMSAALETGTAASTPGTVAIVGAGPGDPGLITRRGLHLLQLADTVLYDRLVAAEILEFARRDAELIPVGKQPHGKSASQSDINAELIERAQRGERVCRLKGGDPLIFGRGAEEVAALAAASVPYELVPGITAASGCAAAAGIPLTHRKIAGAVTIVTGHRAQAHTGLASEPDDIDWSALARCNHTLVIYMSVGRLATLCQQLIDLGRGPETPAALIENGTTAQQRIVGGRLDTIDQLAAVAEVQPPALLIIGNVIDVADKLGWYGGSDLPDAVAMNQNR
jgi:uroporphyrin-III C-methyltransferase/precorrin-2 dehydrogenase/sirohydrochlorin ferrochelatase